ncbi:MAG: ATP-binding protein, partial [Bacteroidales bacterium]|nr:ATP-binding protein [Bacteroidales bacterium]
IDGIEVLEYINKQETDAAVMMITSYASLDLAVKATKNGAFNFVPKPFTPQELKSSVENITKNLFLKRMTQRVTTEERQARFQFLSILSHELKSPVNAIEGYLNIMKDRQAGDDLKDYDMMIARSLERIKGMRTLIMDLLDLTRIESGAKQRSLRKIDVTEIARMAVHSIEPLAKQKNIKIELSADDEAWLMADDKEIEMILNNLLSNAVKYNVEDGKVSVVITTDNNYISIQVQDTGIGMSKEEVDKLFGEFVRIKNAKTSKITGSGLGLSIVKKMAEMYDGNIAVESEPDKGSKFIVNLRQ